MTTIQQVFDIAMHLMDEQSETSGATITTDTQEYKFRTVSILNAVMPSLYPYSDTCDRTKPGRPVCPLLKTGSSYSAPDFAQEIPLDDTISLGILPYALAAHLLAGENAELSAWFLGRYNQSFSDLRFKLPSEFKPIPMPYGAF